MEESKRKFVELADKIHEIATSDLSGKEKFDMLFSDNTVAELQKTPFHFGWPPVELDRDVYVVALDHILSNVKNGFEKEAAERAAEFFREDARNKVFALETNLETARKRIEKGNLQNLSEIFQEMNHSLEQLKELLKD